MQHKTDALPYGYITYTGRALLSHEVDTYNRLSDEIARFQAAGLPVPEPRLNERHRHFVLCAEAR